MIALDDAQIDLLKWLSIADDVSIRSKADEKAAQALAAAGLAHFTAMRFPNSTIRGKASITQAGIDCVLAQSRPVVVGIDMASGPDTTVKYSVGENGEITVMEVSHGP